MSGIWGFDRKWSIGARLSSSPILFFHPDSDAHARFFSLLQLSYKLSTRNQGLDSTLLPPLIFFPNAASWRSLLTARHRPKSFLIDIVVTLHFVIIYLVSSSSISYRLPHTHALYYALIKYEALLHFSSLFTLRPSALR